MREAFFFQILKATKMVNSSTPLLGIGSRVRHAAFGDGVVIRLYPAAYDVCFMIYGIKSVGKDYDRWEIIEAVETTESVTFSEAEKSLMPANTRRP